MNEKDMLTVSQVADALNTHRNTVYQAMTRGHLKYQEVFGHKVIHKDEVAAYIARTRVNGEKPKGRPKGSTNQAKQEA